MDDETNPLDALDEAPGASPAAPATPPPAAAPPASQLQSTPVEQPGPEMADSGNPLDALDEEHPAAETARTLNQATAQTTGDQLPEVTVTADRVKPSTWGDVGGAILPTIGANIESKLAGAQEWKGTTDYNSARKKLWQSMVLPDAVQRAKEKGIPLTEDDEVVSLSQHLGIRPDWFTRDWPKYVNQTDKERQDFQAEQRQRIADAEPGMTEGGQRRRMAAKVSAGVAPNVEGQAGKGVAFEAATMAPDLLVGAGGTVATGGIGGVALMAADIAPGEYSQARNMGLDDRKASTYALLSTVASSVPEVPVMKVVSGSPAGRKILQTAIGEKLAGNLAGKVAGTSITQGVTQSFVAALQQGIDQGLLDENDSVSEALGKIAHSGLVGAVTGAPLGAVHHAFTREPKPATGKSSTQEGTQPTESAEGGAPSGPGATSESQNGPPEETPASPGPAGVPTENAEQPANSDTHEALQALERKDITPPQLEALEKAGLATRNDVGTPRLLPAGRRALNRLNQAKPEAETPKPDTSLDSALPDQPANSVSIGRGAEQPPPHTDEEVPPQRQDATGQNEAHAEWAGLTNEDAAAAPLTRLPEPSHLVGKTPAPTGTTEKTPLTPKSVEVGKPESVNRFADDPDLRASLAAMKNETGWAETGGRVIRNEETGAVTGRTKWVPNAEWWPGRPKGLTETQVHTAIDKALAGDRLSKRETNLVEYLRDVHDARQKTEAYLPERGDTPEDYEHRDQPRVPIDDAHEAGMVSRLADVDPDTFERLAKEHEDSDSGTFLKAVKAALDEHDRQATGGDSTQGARSVAEKAQKNVGPDLFGQDLSRQQALSDEQRRRDAKRSGQGKEVSADTGRPGDLFSTGANRQVDIEDNQVPHRYESTLEAEGFKKGDIVRVNTPNAPIDRDTGKPIHHGERARIHSISRYRRNEPWMFRVGHEFGGQQGLQSHEMALLYRKPEQEGLFSEQLDQAREDTNTTPSDAQKEAGNYAKGRVKFGGMEVAIENPKGSTRKGVSSQGENWERKMKADYGYIKGTTGKDGDAVDVFMTGKPDTGRVFVINQMNPETGGFDEHKVVLGADDRREATKTYRDHYPTDWKGMGTMVEMSTSDFKDWVNSPRARRQLRSERRSDTERRRRVSEMTAEQLRKELLTHDLTEIPNRRAYEEAEKLPVQVSIDVDSLKWINDNMGHESGNELLKAIASSLSQHSDQAFHLSGDEFAIQAHTEAEAQEVMRQVADHLEHATIEVEMPDGKIRQVKGLGVSFGTGETLKEADEALQGHKTRREQEGLRAPRGEAPPGASVRPSEAGRENQAGHPAGEETTRVKEGGADYSELKTLPGLAEKRTGTGPTLDLFSASNKPNPALARKVAGPTAKQERGQKTQTRLVRIGTFNSGIKRVSGWQEAAHILAPLRKQAQENLAALVLDSGNKPLAVVRHSVGTFNKAEVHLGHFLGSILRVPGAAKFYLAHNHPSGNPEPSLQDGALTKSVHDLTRGSGVESAGHVIFRAGSSDATYLPPAPKIGETGGGGPITPASRHQGTPVEQLERQFARTVPLERQGPTLDNEAMAIKAAKVARDQTRSNSGMLLLNNHSKLVRVLPMDVEQMGRLRTGDPSTGIGQVLQAIEGSNGSQAVLWAPVQSQQEMNNLAAALNAAHVGVSGRLIHDRGQGWQNRGSGRLLGTHFFSRREAPAPVPKEEQERRTARVANHVAQTIRQHDLAGAGLPPIQVHRDVTTLPPHILKRIQADNAEHLTGAVYDPQEGHVHVIAANNATEREVQDNILHEVVGHHGLRMVLDPEEYAATMDGIVKDMPDRVEQAAQRNNLDLDDPRQRRAAAEEVIAYAAADAVRGLEIPPPLKPWYHRVFQAVKGFVNRLRGVKYDDAAIHSLIARSLNAVREGAPGVLPGEPMSSQRAPRFYSQLERAVLNSKQAKASPEQWAAMLKNAPGVKQEEVDYLGLGDWLKAQTGPVSKEAIHNQIEQSQLHVEETLRGAHPEGPSATEQALITKQEELRAKGYRVNTNEDGYTENIEVPSRSGGVKYYAEERYQDDVPQEMRDHLEELHKLETAVSDERQSKVHDHSHITKYDRYTMPGGESYRELLLRIPEHAEDTSQLAPPGWAETGNSTSRGSTVNYQSGHWREPNIVAHVRFKDRTDPDGKKVLHLDELQSDWHQAGRDRGYLDDLSPEQWQRVAEVNSTIKTLKNEGMSEEMREQYFQPGRIVKGYSGYDKVLAYHPGQFGPEKPYRSWSVEVIHVNQDGSPIAGEHVRNHSTSPDREYMRQLEEEKQRLVGSKVPPAPFRQTWPMLTMKRMIRWAAEHGYDRVAWSPGDVHNKRYGLSNAVRKLTWDGVPGGPEKHLTLDTPRGLMRMHVEPNGNVLRSISNADEFVGKSLHEIVGREIADKVLGEPTGEMSGGDLEVGGEGQREFYDKILPRDTNKLLKKYGSKVEPREVHTEIVRQSGDWKYVGREDWTQEDVQRRLEAAQRSGRNLVADELHDLNEAMKAGQPFKDAIMAHASNAITNLFAGKLVQEDKLAAEPVHGFDMTPELRQAALSEGFPLFARRQSALALQQPRPQGAMQRIKAAFDAAYESKFSRDIRKYVHPVGMSQESREAARTATVYLGRQAHDSVVSQEALEKFSRAIESLPVGDQLEMIDRIERGQPQANPELQPAADKMREMLDHWRDKVRNLGDGYLDNFIQDYFPHYWAEEDQEKAQRLVANIQGRAPLRGPATFLKQRTIPTIKEGISYGLKPLSTNPLILTLLKTREMQRFVTGVTLMKQYKEDGLAVFLPATKPMPDGWAGIDDNIAKIKQWSDVEQGFIDRGQYIMPEDAARVINNHVGRSWYRGFSPIQSFRVLGNMLNAMQLGFSAFHLGFTTLDAIISKTAVGIERGLRGEWGKAAAAFGEAATGPGAAILNVRRGHNLLQAYTNPSGATPELAKLVTALQEGGGRAHMDKYYQLAQGVSPFRGTGFRSLAGDIWDALHAPTDKLEHLAHAAGNFPKQYATKLLRELQALKTTHGLAGIPFEVAGRVIRASTSWIMEHLVPMQKLGVFSDLAADHLRRNPNQDPHERAAAMQKIWASVDNRLGEMVYDNLFWNRTMKDTLHLGIRAVGWNLGTWREIAGAPSDLVSAIGNAVEKRRYDAEDIGHKIPYVLAMAGTTALYGAVANYLLSGEGPQELKDYFFPRTGGTTNYGTPQRVSLPSYVKDVYEYSQQPGTTILNKLNPIFNVIGEMWRNEDFFGNPITDPGESGWDAFKHKAGFVASEATPFSWQGKQQIAQTDQGGLGGAVRRILPSVGITPAPGYVTSPEQIETRKKFEAEKKYVSEMSYQYKRALADKDEEKAKDYLQRLIAAKKHMGELTKDVGQNKAKAAVARRKNATALRQEGKPAMASLVASLPLEPDMDALNFFAQHGQEAGA